MSKRRGIGRGGKGSEDKGQGGSKIANLAAWQCPECENACEEEVENCIECFVCKNWYHQKCVKLDDTIFSSFCDPLQPNLQWVCGQCLDNKKEVQSRNDRKLDKLMDLLPMVEALNARFTNLEQGLLKGEALEQKIEEVVDRKLAEALDEQREVDRRKKNLIIWNLKESTKLEIAEKKEEDLESAKTLLRKLVPLEDDEVIEPVRLGKAQIGNRPRLLKITMKSEEKKREVLKKAPELNRGVQADKRVYVNPDHTQKQRDEHKSLKEEKKRRTDAGEENLAIRHGKIVVVKPRSEDNQAPRGRGRNANAREDSNGTD
jgi:hypothetical protein